MGLIVGIALCLGSVIPMMIASVLFESDFAIALSGCIMLMMIAAGTALLVRNAMIQRSSKGCWGSYGRAAQKRLANSLIMWYDGIIQKKRYHSMSEKQNIHRIYLCDSWQRAYRNSCDIQA